MYLHYVEFEVRAPFIDSVFSMTLCFYSMNFVLHGVIMNKEKCSGGGIKFARRNQFSVRQLEVYEENALKD